ncbi:Fuc2NAc and GlcNAc transferase [Rhizobiaceae bacterium]|nr:Fuc2NAc and GlcNAc transferase [Rhizobiaceae bacterium]
MMILALLFGGFVTTAGLLAVFNRVLPADFLAAAVTARSNHSGPARQIGGLAAAPVAIAVMVAVAFAGGVDAKLAFGAAAGATLLAVLGLLDDRRDLAAGAKLAGQFAAAFLFLWFLEPGLRLLPTEIPLAAERALIAVALVWWINMTNFMDGLDLMVVAGIGVPHAVIALAGAAGMVDAAPTILSAAIAGALFGFAPFNLPPARVFLGDSGSLALGLLSGAVALMLAMRSPWAALLPFAFFLADSVSTIVLRALRRENVFAAHSSHAYQVVRRAGRPVPSIVAEVALVSLLSGGLAIGAMRWGSPFDVAAFACGGALAAASVYRMRRQALAAKR